MRFRLALAFVSVALAACNSTPAQHAAATTAQPSPVRMLPNCSGQITAIYAVHVNGVNGGVSGDSIFCVSASSTTDFNTRLLEWPVQGRQLLAADARSVVQLEGGNVDGSSLIRVFDPASEGSRALGTLSEFGINDPGPVAAVMSPDGTELALGGAHKLLVVELGSTAVRTLASDPSRWLTSIRWTPSRGPPAASSRGRSGSRVWAISDFSTSIPRLELFRLSIRAPTIRSSCHRTAGSSSQQPMSTWATGRQCVIPGRTPST